MIKYRFYIDFLSIIMIIMNYFSKKSIFRVYLYWGDSKRISITQNKHPISLDLAPIWKDPKSMGSRPIDTNTQPNH